MRKESPAAAMGAAVLGLVAFMLAFTFGIAAARFDTRKQLVRDDANAIRTAYLRADFLPDPHRGEFKGLVKEYLDLRVSVVQPKYAVERQASLDTMSNMHARPWDYAIANAWTDLNSDIGALLVESVNQIINVHALRVVWKEALTEIDAVAIPPVVEFPCFKLARGHR